MDFRVLGPLAVEDERGQLALDGPRVRALLAFLLLHPNTPVSTADLLDEIWGEDLPKSGATAVQNAVARLRKVLGERVVTTGAGYFVRVEQGELDLTRFRELVERSAVADRVERASLLREALALWRGEPLGSLGAAAFVDRERARLEDERLGALENRIDADLELGRHAALIAELSALAAEHPLDERFRAQLMLSLYRSGRQAAALDVYRETRRLLADELGLEPGPALRELEQAVLRQDSALDAPLRTAPAVEAGRPRRRHLVWLVGLAALGVAGAATAVALDRRGHPVARSAVVKSTGTRPAATTTTATSGTSTTRRQTTTHEQQRPHHTHTSVAVTSPATTPKATTAPEQIDHTTRAATTHAAATTAARSKHKGTGKTRTTTTATTAAGGATTSDQVASDTFDGPPDESFWHIFTQGGGPRAEQRNGQVEISLPSDATPSDNFGQISGNYESRCSLAGDFDAQVDFDLLQWPLGNGVTAALVATVGPRPAIPRYIYPQVNRQSLRGQELYQSYVFTNSASIDTDDRDGRLRLARRDSVFTTYYWKRQRWVKVDSTTMKGAAVISFTAIADQTTFAGLDVSVAFDNFMLFADQATCN